MNLRINSLLRYLSTDLFPYPHKSFPDAKLVAFQVPVPDAVLTASICLPEDADHLTLLIPLPFVIKRKRQIASVSELIARINHRLYVGHFVFNVDAGSIRFEVGHVIEVSEISMKALYWIISGATDAIALYYPAFVRHICDGQSSVEAIRPSVLLDEEHIPKLSPRGIRQIERLKSYLGSPTYSAFPVVEDHKQQR